LNYYNNGMVKRLEKENPIDNFAYLPTGQAGC